MQYVIESKKIKETDIPVIAKFIIEVIRRYPSTVEMFESSFQESLKTIGSRTEKGMQAIRKNVFLLYCELCLCQIVGKMTKSISEIISTSKVRFPFSY